MMNHFNNFIRLLSRRCLAAWVSFGMLVVPAAAGERPNVVFFAVDDLCDWVGAMGHDQAITPNMDKLARSGVLFTNAHAPGVYCAPSRTAIFTGRYASTTGCYGTEIYHHDHPELVPLQLAFQRSGYATFGSGKLFHHREGFLDQRGWDEFFVRNETLKRKGWRIETWPMAEAERDVPFPDPFPASIYNRGKQVTGGLFLEWGSIPDEEEETMADTRRVNYACEVLKRHHDKPFFLAVGLYAPHFPNYAPQKYFDLYDADEIQLPPYVPFVWSGPGLAAGAKVDATVSLIDMYPTFVDLCGLESVRGLEGESLVDALRDPQAARDRNVLLPYHDPGGYAIINQRWRYIHYSDGTEELYDVRRDPHEWDNLARLPEFVAIKRQLKESAPRAFVEPATPKNDLRLVIEGDRFRWESKK